jgi:hypothetical protein
VVDILALLAKQQPCIGCLFYKSSLDLYFTKALVLSLDVELRKMLKYKSAFGPFSKFWIHIWHKKTGSGSIRKQIRARCVIFCLGWKFNKIKHFCSFVFLKTLFLLLTFSQRTSKIYPYFSAERSIMKVTYSQISFFFCYRFAKTFNTNVEQRNLLWKSNFIGKSLCLDQALKEKAFFN